MFALFTTKNVGWGFTLNPASQIAQEARDNDAYAFAGIATATKAYAVNGLNQYTAVAGTGQTYDANGNLTGDGTNAYIYDGENRLVSATAAVVTATLTYDPLGRLWQLVKPGTSDTRFLYDGDALVAEYNSAGTLAQRYTHGSNAAADDPLIWYDGGATKRYLHADHLGSIVAATNAGIGAPAILSYDEYGVPGTGNVGRFQYTGQILLSELGSASCAGLYYYKARMYSACLGRFLQIDPVGYKDQINLYAYVADDPINGNDWSGLGECDTGSRLENNSGGCKVVEGYQIQQRGVPTSKQERQDLAKGNADSYWASREKRGDPLGKEGTEFSLSKRGNSFVEESKSKLLDSLLLKHGAVEHYEKGLHLTLGGNREAAAREYNQVRLQLAMAHMRATDADIAGTPHLLSAFQIAQYHWAVFSQHGLPANAFGGSPFLGTRVEVLFSQYGWCWSCDR